MQQSHLDRLVAQAHSFLMRWRLQRAMRMAAATALTWLVAGPLLLLLAQWMRSLQGAQPPVNLWLLLASALLGPVLFVAIRLAGTYRRWRPGRQTALALFDAQLHSQDRLVTADEFLGNEYTQGGASGAFMQAAVDDAEQFVQRAMQTELASLPMPDWTLRPASLLGVLGAIAVTLIMVFGLNGVRAGERELDAQVVVAALQAGAAPDVDQKQRADGRRDARLPRDPEHELLNSAQPQTVAPARQLPMQKEEAAQGQSNAGASSTTQSSSNSSNAAGQPSSEKSAARPKADEEAQGFKRDGRKPRMTPPPPQKNTRLAMDSASGQGKSSDASSQIGQFESPEEQDKAPPGSKQEDEGEDREDEDEQEKTSSAVKPDLRDRKPPANRNLSPGAPRSGPPKNQNGRGGPGPRKKTRGVPSMILGIPVADRVQGKPSAGRSKVTQENARPTAETHPELEAQQRLARGAAAGHVEQQRMLPWMQALVRDYFLSVHEQSGAQSAQPSNN